MVKSLNLDLGTFYNDYDPIKIQTMTSNAQLRKTIEEAIGQKLLERYCQDRGNERVKIFPPILESKFIDKLPPDVILEGVNAQEKEHQDAYAAEVKVHLCLQDVTGNYLVVHQLEYTHQQYSAFLPLHKCNKKNCPKGPDDHWCHKEPKEIEGESDFVIVGDHFAGVFEVKGLSRHDSVHSEDVIKYEGCCDRAKVQGKRMKDLIKSIDPLVMIYEFTVFPNISTKEVNGRCLANESILYREDIHDSNWMIEWLEQNAPTHPERNHVESSRRIKRCLLGLWCINHKNKWDLTDCSLSKCISVIDEKLRRSLVTREAVEQAVQTSRNNKEKTRKKKYPDNRDMVQEADIFQKYLNIGRLTKYQLQLFRNEERFLWVEGPAGTGKTMVMLGKIIHLALNSAPDKRILLISQGYNTSPAIANHLELLNNVHQDITCELIAYNHKKMDGNISEKLEKAHNRLRKQLSANGSKVVLLKFRTCLGNSIDSLITMFDYVFVDDFQSIHDSELDDIHQEPTCGNKTIISAGLIPIVKNSSSNSTSLWIFSDEAQSCYSKTGKLMLCRELYSSFTAATNELRSYFDNSKYELSINLRNSHEIAILLSVIRKSYEKMDFAGSLPVAWPQQNEGHLLHGNKPAIYICKADETFAWNWIEVLINELEILKGSDCCVQNKDIAVLIEADRDHIGALEKTVKIILKRWENTDDKISVRYVAECMSAEWSAVIFICRFWFECYTVALHGNRKKDITYSYTIPNLYSALSRARVYTTAIVYSYSPHTCENTDLLLGELRQRCDACRVIDVSVD